MKTIVESININEANEMNNLLLACTFGQFVAWLDHQNKNNKYSVVSVVDTEEISSLKRQRGTWQPCPVYYDNDAKTWVSYIEEDGEIDVDDWTLTDDDICYVFKG